MSFFFIVKMYYTGYMENQIGEASHKNETTDTLKGVLELEVNRQNPSNINFVIREIYKHFAAAVEANDKPVLVDSIKWVKIHAGYLGEKYQDSSEQRQYLETVDRAIEHLSSLLDAG